MFKRRNIEYFHGVYLVTVIISIHWYFNHIATNNRSLHYGGTALTTGNYKRWDGRNQSEQKPIAHFIAMGKQLQKHAFGAHKININQKINDFYVCTEQNADKKTIQYISIIFNQKSRFRLHFAAVFCIRFFHSYLVLFFYFQ